MIFFFAYLIDATNKVTIEIFIDLPYEYVTNQLIKTNSKQQFILSALLEKLEM